MGVSAEILPYVTLAVLVFLAGSTFLRWLQDRNRTQGFLASAIGLLAGLLVFGELEDLVGWGWLSDAGLASFLASAYALLGARHTVDPLPRWVLVAAGAALGSTAVLISDAGVGLSDGGPASSSTQVVTYAGLLVWILCIVDPVVLFWREGSRRRSLIQRARLQILSLGFGSLVILISLIVALPDSEVVDDVGNALQLAILVLLTASFAPPRLLRRRWREREERSLIAAVPLFTQGRSTELVQAGLEWAIRLLGADAGFVIGTDGKVLEEDGIPAGDAEEVAAFVRDGEGVIRVGSRPSRLAVVAPFELETGIGRLVVLTGPFTPPIGAEERRLLEHWAAGMAAALDRSRLDDLRDAFVTAVSHELRTPLTSILGIGHTLARAEEQGIDGSRRRDLVDGLVRNAERLERLLSDLLDLDRLTRGVVEAQRRPTAVGDLARRVADRMETLRGRLVRVDAEVSEAHVDPAMTERIVESLLANAAKHTPAEADVTVRITSVGSGGGLEIVVSDGGPGVPLEQRETIFQPFRRGPGAPAHAPGTGVGLALVARLAELHGGRAWVEDGPDGGAQFRVHLAGPTSGTAEQATFQDTTPRTTLAGGDQPSGSISDVGP